MYMYTFWGIGGEEGVVVIGTELNITAPLNAHLLLLAPFSPPPRRRRPVEGTKHDTRDRFVAILTT